jgi:hypothetical protein
MATLTDDNNGIRFAAALRKDGRTYSLVEYGDNDEDLGAELVSGAKAIDLKGWQSRIAEGYLSAKSKLERMHIWADAHGIEVTGENGGALLDLYQRDPEAELIEEWCDHHRNQNS